MNSNKVVYGLSISIIVVLLIVAIVFIVIDVTKSNKSHHPHHHPFPPPTPSRNNIGGNTDRHGCLTSAGYKWCKKKMRCIRPWEENC